MMKLLPIVFASILLLAGCSGERKDSVKSTQGREASVPAKDDVRREFVIVRELVRQHALQQGNGKRIEAVEKSLKSKFPALPDKGTNSEERRIYNEARAVVGKLPR